MQFVVVVMIEFNLVEAKLSVHKNALYSGLVLKISKLIQWLNKHCLKTKIIIELSI